MSNLSVTPPKIRSGENTLSSCINLPSLSSSQPSPVIDIQPLIELSKCKSVTITNSGNRYSPYSDIFDTNQSSCNGFSGGYKNQRFDPYFLLGCIIALVVLMILIIIVGYWILINKSNKEYSRNDKKFITRCIYGTMIVIFIVILFLFYLVLRC